MEVRLPNLGEGAESGTVVSVLVKDGDSLEEGQTMVELENEKAVAPIPAPAAGKVRSVRVKEGDRLSVGQVILTLEAGKSEKEPAKPKAKKKESQEEESQEEETTEAEEDEGEEPAAEESEGDGEPGEGDREEGSPAAAPSIRRLARELGLDLRRIKGSERGGRIVMADVRNFIQRLQKQGGVGGKPASGEKAPVASAKPAIDFSRWGSVARQPMSQVRQTISRRLAENWVAVPQVTQFDEADITRVMELRARYAAAYDEQGAKLTLTSFALKALVATLQKHPIFNSSLDESAREIVFKHYFHIGLAVDTEHGLFVPVLRDVDRKSMLELSREVLELAEKARARKLSGEELQGGAFTISNQGGIGGGHFTPLVNRPEVAILGLGRGGQRPVVVEGQVTVRSLLPLAVSYDHRVIDGGSAARFVVDLAMALREFSEEAVKL